MTVEVLASNERMTSITIELPYPPSVDNHYTPRSGRFILKAESRQYKKTVAALVCAEIMRIHCHQKLAFPLNYRLRHRTDVYVADRRRRDLGNLDKALMDALVSAKLIQDDSLIDDTRYVRHYADQQYVVVSFERMDNQEL